MNNKFKKVMVTLTSVVTVATIGGSLSQVGSTVYAAKHHKKHHPKKSVKKTKKTTNNTATASNRAYKAYKDRLNSDIGSYNSIVSSFYEEIDTGGNGSYEVDNNNGNPNYSNGNYTDISNSLNDIVHDMNTNNDSYDLGVNETDENIGIESLQQSADQLYALFRGRFSSDENNTLTQQRDNIIKNKVSDGDNSTYVLNQWNNVKNFMDELSKAVLTLNK